MDSTFVIVYPKINSIVLALIVDGKLGIVGRLGRSPLMKLQPELKLLSADLAASKAGTGFNVQNSIGKHQFIGRWLDLGGDSELLDKFLGEFSKRFGPSRIGIGQHDRHKTIDRFGDIYIERDTGFEQFGFAEIFI